jgi:hypothetical protein
LATEGARCPMVRLPEVFTSLLRGVSVPPRKTSESSRDFQAAYDGMRRLLDVAQSGYCDIAAGLFLSPGGVHAAQGCYLQGGFGDRASNVPESKEPTNGPHPSRSSCTSDRSRATAHLRERQATRNAGPECKILHEIHDAAIVRWLLDAC